MERSNSIWRKYSYQYYSSTEEWNGISWVNSCNMITARKDLGSAGSKEMQD